MAAEDKDGDEAATLASLEEEATEISLTNFFVNRPCTWLCICYVLMLIISIITISSGMIELSE